MIFQPILGALTEYRVRVFFLAVVVFGTYIVFVIRPVFILRREMDVSFDFLLRRMALAKKSLVLSRQGYDLPEYADKTGLSEALSLVQALAVREKIEVDDIRVRGALRKGNLLEIRMRGQESALTRFMSSLKELPFLVRIVSLHVKAASGNGEEFQADLYLEKIDFVSTPEVFL